MDDSRSNQQSQTQTTSTNATRAAATTNAAHGNGAKVSLYQTAKVEIVNPVTKRTLKVRVCLDSLSNRSYITESAARQLGLKGESSENMHVAVFGSRKAVSIPTTCVEFGVKERDGNVKMIDANTTRIIT